DGDGPDLVIPLDREAPEFGDLLKSAWARLSVMPIQAHLVDLLRLQAAGGVHDSLRFRKETAAPPGLIPWSMGESLITAARATLVAGAKAHLGTRRYFGNAHGQFAQRYLQ